MYQDMQQGHIGGPAFYNEGAVYTGKGKYRIQFLGSDNPREVTKRVVIVAVAVVLAIILVATFLAGKDPTRFPYETKLHSAIGQPMEKALVNAGLKTAELTETDTGVYTLEDDVKIDGVPFDLQLYVDDGVLSGFAYTTEYEADTKKAAKDIYNILVDLRIDSYTLEDGAEPIEVNRKTLREYLGQGNDLQIKTGVDITPSELVGALRQYLETLETSEDWEGNVHGYLVRPALLYLDENIAYIQDTNTVKIQISYRVEAEREGN